MSSANRASAPGCECNDGYIEYAGTCIENLRTSCLNPDYPLP